MEVDESYAEYVAARWSMLYRLAALLVGEPDADDLTQAALVAAYLDWADVRDAPSADDHVKQIMARTAGRLAGRPRNSKIRAHENVDPDGTDQQRVAPPASRAELWARFEELAPRQRIMVVLRGYEALEETEIGTALGCSAATVAAEVAEWDAQVDEAVVREELIVRADQVDVPLPPTDTLITRGRQLRRRRRGRRVRWTVFAALLLVTALALTSVLQGMSSESTAKPVRLPALPGSLADLPRGHAPRISYSDGTTLHLGDGRTVALIDLPTAMATTRSGIVVALPPGRITRIDLDTGGSRVITESASGQLVSDPGGSHVAWLLTGAGKAWVTVGSV